MWASLYALKYYVPVVFLSGFLLLWWWRNGLYLKHYVSIAAVVLAFLGTYNAYFAFAVAVVMFAANFYTEYWGVIAVTMALLMPFTQIYMAAFPLISTLAAVKRLRHSYMSVAASIITYALFGTGNAPFMYRVAAAALPVSEIFRSASSVAFAAGVALSIVVLLFIRGISTALVRTPRIGNLGYAIGAAMSGLYPAGLLMPFVFVLEFVAISLLWSWGVVSFSEVSKGAAITKGITSVKRDAAVSEAKKFEAQEGVVEAKKGSAVINGSWEKLAGIDELKAKLEMEVIAPFKDGQLAKKYGVEPPHGILLYGPPGTGKTTLMRGIAERLGFNYVEINPGEILSKWYGESEHRVRDAFERAIEMRPSVIAMDEIDGIGKERSSYTSDDVTPRVLNVVLMEMDRIRELNAEVLVVATTNRPQMLDSAILRSGRLDRVYFVGLPDRRSRAEIFRKLITSRGVKVDELDYDRLAVLSERFSGADIESVVNSVFARAMYYELQTGKEPRISQEHFEEAIKRTRPSASYVDIEEFEKFRVRFTREREVELREEVGVPEVTFDDVGDLEDIKRDLRESIELPLMYQGLAEKVGLRITKGILLYGPPGNGKTLLAKAVANSLKVNFFHLSGADLVKRGIEEAPVIIKETFNLAKDNRPSIVFIDEIDQVAPRRGLTKSEGLRMITAQLLQEVDGLKSMNGVVVLAATNMPEDVDPAILRSGRLEKHIYVPPPNFEARKKILLIHLKGLTVKGSLDRVAELTEGFSGADLENLANEVKKKLVKEAAEGKELRTEVSEEELIEGIAAIKGRVQS